MNFARFPEPPTRWRLSLAAATAAAARAESVLTVAMTAGDIPATTGNPDQGFEGFRFVGYNLYDGLALWDLSRSDKPSDIKPGLATAWEVDPEQPQALDLPAAPGREVARRLPVHRRRRGVELRPHHRREGAAVLHAADGAHARLHHQLRIGREDRRPHRRDQHQGAWNRCFPTR